MNSKQTRYSRQWRVAVVIVFFAAGALIVRPRTSVAAPGLENYSVITADVLQRTAVEGSTLGIEPAQKLWRFTLRIISVDDVAGFENPVRNQDGKIIEVFSNLANAPATAEKRVRLKISFQGDGPMGRYWIVGINEPKSK